MRTDIRRPATRPAALAALAAIAAFGAFAVAPAYAQKGDSPAEAELDAASGFLYGKVTTAKDRVFQGVLRWDDEEAAWDDHFNSGKVDLPYLDEYSDEKKTRTFEIFGRKFNVNWGGGETGRQLVVRFGDIARIDVLGDSEAKLTMRDGSQFEVEGVGNDVEATIRILDTSLGLLEVEWETIARIEFAQAPAGTVGFGDRLWGSVKTTAGTFEGFVQWDKQECLSIDALDGEEDGVKMSIPFGQIASIAKHPSRNASQVVLRDGRELVLDDSNDVDDDNRGILVEDRRYGRVEVPWSAFQRIDMRFDRGSGPDYATYAASGGPQRLRGEVVDRSGSPRSGALVYDLDEAHGWELLDGVQRKISYSIPFSKIASIAPAGTDGATVTLRSGERLELSDSHDVNEDNSGVLVLDGDGRGGVLVEWSDIQLISLQP